MKNYKLCFFYHLLINYINTVKKIYHNGSKIINIYYISYYFSDQNDIALKKFTDILKLFMF